jgi:Tfp pilus assembly protein PilX
MRHRFSFSSTLAGRRIEDFAACPEQERRHRAAGRRFRRGQHGIALIVTLLMLLLLSGMAAAMLFSVNSDAMTNNYYSTFRASFYAADSGLNIARRALYDQLTAAIPSTFSNTTQPIPASTPTTVQNYIASTYGQSYTSLLTGGTGSAAASWPAQFKIDPSSSKTYFNLASCTAYSSYTAGACSGSAAGTCTTPASAACFAYVYNYQVTAYGQSRGTETTTLVESGNLNVTVPVSSAGTTTSFAGWGMFIGNSNLCDGSYLVPGLITGPVFTNGGWTFGDTGTYTFTDSVGSTSSQAGYQYTSGSCSGNCNQSSSSSNTCGGSSIKPTFQSAFNLGQSAVTLPPNDYNQLGAVLNGQGTNTTQVTNSQLNAGLRNISGTAYPSAGATSGVYLPYTTVQGTNTFTGGGIYVEGNASVTLSPSGSAQVYTITQNSTTTTVTINNATNTTTVSSGSTNLTISGVPQQLNSSGNPVTYANSLYPGDATMLYVHGNVNALSGPGQGQAAINNGTALTITASGNVTITGDILYKTEPVTFTQNQIQGTGPDTLIPGNDNGQALGIFTATGNINLNNSQGNGNLEVDATLATISQGGSGGLTNTGNAINTLTIVGGRIQNTIQNINTTTRNVYFDRRFGSSFAPPWFPSTTVTINGQDSASANPPVFQRLQWSNQTSTTQW